MNQRGQGSICPKSVCGARPMRRFWLLIVFLFFLGACAKEVRLPDGERLFSHDDLDRASLHQAIQRSLEFLDRLPPDRLVGEWPRPFTAREVKESLLAFREHLQRWERPDRLLEAVRANFDFYQSAGEQGDGVVLFTGYYQPVLEASLTETPAHRFPIYRRPDDLIEVELGSFMAQLRGEKVVGRVEGKRLVPYFSRHEIDVSGRLKGKGYEIAWVKDPLELFSLHIQGSGLLRLGDGRLLHLNYAASNGRRYRSIGRLLIERGKIPEREISMQRVRRYILDHPRERDEILAQNESYVFFRFVQDGPLGSLEVPLTPGRSIATDSRIFPKGALAFIISQKPVLDARGNLVGWQPFARFVLNQDTGSAIRGPGRVDLYFGSGPAAGAAAGYVKNKGKIYFLMKKAKVS